MGVPVTVDSDDLETLLFASGAVKQVEQTLAAAKKDESWCRAQPKIGGAVNKVLVACQAATRRRDMPDVVDRAMKPIEAELLEALCVLSWQQTRGIKILNAAAFRPLVGLGLVQIGTSEERVTWQGSDEPWYRKELLFKDVRATPRGQETFNSIVPGWQAEEEGLTDVARQRWADRKRKSAWLLRSVCGDFRAEGHAP